MLSWNITDGDLNSKLNTLEYLNCITNIINSCLLYTSDAADEEDSVDLGGRRIIKKKTGRKLVCRLLLEKKNKQTKKNNERRLITHTVMSDIDS